MKSVFIPADDATAAFYRAWLADPKVHLPAGTWQVVARAVVYDGTTCGAGSDATADHDLTAPPLILHVVS